MSFYLDGTYYDEMSLLSLILNFIKAQKSTTNQKNCCCWFLYFKNLFLQPV